MPFHQTSFRGFRVPTVLLAVVAMIGTLTAATPPDRSREASAAQFVVVVHVANPLKAIDREDLSRIFLKREAKWSTGVVVAPVDLPVRQSAREAFTKVVHGRSVNAIRAFWQQQIFSGREVPPPEKSSAQEVLEFVKANPGAVGYVSADVPLIDGIKTLVVQ